ncbi:metallophosphoesterase [Sphaerisporangium fuscum]|uniref:metallophosphoesterase n=1 Tax=Sphaerisporangium fuscum TaxID=2835868 RepID=UPI001BDC4546|nr:metallophosphoesterase [Sphaerisporangium fuscum]
MRKLLAVAAIGVVAVLGSAGAADAGSASRTDHGQAASNRSYEIALIGDMPYGDTGRIQFPRVIDEINADHRIAFTVFDGDIKNGGERCDQWQHDLAAKNFAAFRRPLVYVPGDNEWTDCDRASNGGYDPNERLALVRRTFAATPHSLGQRTLPLQRQSAAYPENVRWQYGAVTYVGLNVPGSDNNAPQFDSSGKQVDGDQAEYDGRNAANLDWLDKGFAAARAAGSKAVVVTLQADMWTAPTAHFADTKKKLAQLAIGFPGQVLLVNGDSHFFKLDKPLTDANNQVIQNVTRVQTFGSDQNHWVSAEIDPGDPDVFTFHQHIVAANQPTYVSP